MEPKLLGKQNLWEQETEIFLVSHYGGDIEWNYSLFHPLIPGPVYSGYGWNYTRYLLWFKEYTASAL